MVGIEILNKYPMVDIQMVPTQYFSHGSEEDPLTMVDIKVFQK